MLKAAPHVVVEAAGGEHRCAGHGDRDAAPALFEDRPGDPLAIGGQLHHRVSVTPESWRVILRRTAHDSGFPDEHACEDWLYRLDRLTDDDERLLAGEHVSRPAADSYRHHIHAADQ